MTVLWQGLQPGADLPRDPGAVVEGQVVSGVVILAALKREHGYTGSYSAVWRLLATLRRETPPEATVRLDSAPGEAAQVDFGALDPGRQSLWLKASDGMVTIYDDFRPVAAHGRASRPGERRTVTGLKFNSLPEPLRCLPVPQLALSKFGRGAE